MNNLNMNGLDEHYSLNHKNHLMMVKTAITKSISYVKFIFRKRSLAFGTKDSWTEDGWYCWIEDDDFATTA